MTEYVVMYNLIRDFVAATQEQYGHEHPYSCTGFNNRHKLERQKVSVVENSQVMCVSFGCWL